MSEIQLSIYNPSIYRMYNPGLIVSNQKEEFGYFRDKFIFANSIKRHISGVDNSRLRQDLPISINERVVLPFREGFIFTKLRICEVSRDLSPRENFRIYSIQLITRSRLEGIYFITGRIVLIVS